MNTALWLLITYGWSTVEEEGDACFSIIWFLSLKHTFILYLMHYLGNMFGLTIESSSGPYRKIQILICSKCVMGSQIMNKDLSFYVRA